jgi:hypothetical protein
MKNPLIEIMKIVLNYWQVQRAAYGTHRITNPEAYLQDKLSEKKAAHLSLLIVLPKP